MPAFLLPQKGRGAGPSGPSGPSSPLDRVMVRQAGFVRRGSSLGGFLKRAVKAGRYERRISRGC